MLHSLFSDNDPRKERPSSKTLFYTCFVNLESHSQGGKAILLILIRVIDILYTLKRTVKNNLKPANVSREKSTPQKSCGSIVNVPTVI